MYIDMTYILLVLPAVILSLWASANVKRTYQKYSLGDPGTDLHEFLRF